MVNEPSVFEPLKFYCISVAKGSPRSVRLCGTEALVHTIPILIILYLKNMIWNFGNSGIDLSLVCCLDICDSTGGFLLL